VCLGLYPAAGCAEVPGWAPPGAVTGCLICTVPISWASLGDVVGYGEVQGVAGEIRGKEAVEDQPLHSPPHCALQLCLKALVKSRAGDGTPKTRGEVGDGEQEGESDGTGEMGLGITAGAGAPKLHLSTCGWTHRGAPGMWILGAVMARFFSSYGVYGRLWFWRAVPVSPQPRGLGMTDPCGTGVCSRGQRAGRALSPVASPGSPSDDNRAEVSLLCGPLLLLRGS